MLTDVEKHLLMPINAYRPSDMLIDADRCKLMLTAGDAD